MSIAKPTLYKGGNAHEHYTLFTSVNSRPLSAKLLADSMQDWNWLNLISYYQQRYHKTIRPVFRRVECDIPKDCTCPACSAPVDYLSWNFLLPHFPLLRSPLPHPQQHYYYGYFYLFHAARTKLAQIPR